MKNETNRLDEIARDSWYVAGIAPRTIEYSGAVFSRYIRGGAILELGPAEGAMTIELMKLSRDITLVDGARTFCDILIEKFPAAKVICSLFEDYRPDKKFDYIILGHVLEHVDDPVGILTLVKSWLAPEGLVLAAVPNARSLHRQAAVIMGLLSCEDQLNETDRHHGHRRVFNPESFRSCFVQSGFKIKVFGGYWMKPVANPQIEANWTPKMLNAFMELGERYPDIAAEIYVIAT